ncbi:unnamed protein product [Polarella glacialis]|uniref:Uncharacterized protein n=2 Tax=Polarella glacialis TaxID=89957 RepID=A0A813DKW9_POLGL|nr:unnamed protein product [Polarella glacialis]
MLSSTKMQLAQNRVKIFKALVTDWHPDRHASAGKERVATKVFQWLQVVKSWYLEESSASSEGHQQPLPDCGEDGSATLGAPNQYLHPSGALFQVW